MAEHADLDAEFDRLMIEGKELRAEHESLERRPKDIPAHRAHRQRLHAHIDKLHEYVKRLRQRRMKESEPDDD